MTREGKDHSPGVDVPPPLLPPEATGSAARQGHIFSAGVDLLRVLEGGPDYLATFLPALRRLFATLFCFPKPVVAAINGHAIANGCVLACAADARLRLTLERASHRLQRSTAPCRGRAPHVARSIPVSPDHLCAMGPPETAVTRGVHAWAAVSRRDVERHPALQRRHPRALMHATIGERCGWRAEEHGDPFAQRGVVLP